MSVFSVQRISFLAEDSLAIAVNKKNTTGGAPYRSAAG